MTIELGVHPPNFVPVTLVCLGSRSIRLSTICSPKSQRQWRRWVGDAGLERRVKAPGGSTAHDQSLNTVHLSERSDHCRVLDMFNSCNCHHCSRFVLQGLWGVGQEKMEQRKQVFQLLSYISCPLAVLVHRSPLSKLCVSIPDPYWWESAQAGKKDEWESKECA